MNKTFKKKYLYLSILFALSGSALAEEAKDPQGEANEADALDFNKIIVTGVARKTTKMDSSVSVSRIDPEDIEIQTPRTTAEIFRNIPGIRSESTGGEGNANIAVRGLPVASGGAKFFQIQEDGLPVIQFGDIAFGNADIFTRADATISHIEAIRGGSASTLVSNAPGGIVNMISKTGNSEGGSISQVIGLDYDTSRTDFEYGGDLSDSVRFHLGGFIRNGEGSRDAGYEANSGSQIKFNMTKEFENGYARIYIKHLDDRAIGYLPMPMLADGSSLPGFDSQTDTPHSVYLQSTLRTGSDGELSRGKLEDGMHSKVDSVGLEFSFDAGEGWTIENRLRTSNVSGSFIAPFPAEVAAGDQIAESIGGVGSTLVYANGPSAGDTFTAAANGNGLVMRTHIFDTEMNDFGSIVNDLKLTKTLDNMSYTFGYYQAKQDIEMSWLWNSYLMEVKGDNAALLDVVDAGGATLSDNGLYAYGVPFWGNCCTRKYDTQYKIEAPYLAISGEFGNWSIDASVREDSGTATGSYAGAVQSTIDMNRDGVISAPEQSVSSIDNANSSPVNYDWSYTSFSVGANYKLDNEQAIFGRISSGARANADRLLFGKIRADGSVAKEDAIDEVDQYEVGYKLNRGDFGLFVTGFYAETEEQNFEATSQKFFDRVYEALGIEFEGAYRAGDFEIKGSLTWTDSEIASDALNPSVVGNTPRRQADVIYSLTTQYKLENSIFGVNLIGTTDAYAQDNNDLKFDGYNQVNAFVLYDLSKDLSLSLNINNLFDEVGITEAEEGSVPANGVIRARTISGRTSSLTLRYSF